MNNNNHSDPSFPLPNHKNKNKKRPRNDPSHSNHSQEELRTTTNPPQKTKDKHRLEQQDPSCSSSRIDHEPKEEEEEHHETTTTTDPRTTTPSGSTATATTTVERISWNSISAEEFFHRFVALRRPCILDNCIDLSSSSSSTTNLQQQQQDNHTLLPRVTPDLLEHHAGSCRVQVEHRSTSQATFGQDRSSEFLQTMTVRELLQKLRPSNQPDDDCDQWYLSTQQGSYYQDFMEHTLLKATITRPPEKNPMEDAGVVPQQEQQQQQQQPLIPPQFPLAGHLCLESINVWMGATRPTTTNSTTTTSSTNSGLHHDFHDNFYVLQAGSKRFCLYPPQTPNIPVHGTLQCIHDNGLRSYTSNPTRADGVPLQLAQQQERQEQEKDVSNDHKQDSSWQDDKEDDSEQEEDDDDEEEEVVLGKGFDYASSDEDDDPVALKQETMMMMQQLHTTMRKRGPLEESQSDQEQHQVLRPPPPNETEEPEPSEPKPLKQTSSSSRPRPCNFSTIDPYPSNGQVPNLDPPLQVQLKAGQCLYLPASWFHCVFSSSAVLSSNGSTPRTTTTTIRKKDRNDDSIHLAVNYWYHPPDNLQTYQKPYRNVAFWKDYKSKRHAQNDDDNDDENE